MLHLSLSVSLSLFVSLSVKFCYHIYCYDGQSAGCPKHPETHAPWTLGYTIVQKSRGKVRIFFCFSIYYHLISL